MSLYRVGVCDDEKTMLRINQRFLKQIDSEAESFELEIYNFMRGKDIIVYTKSHPIDIAILDIDVIDMSGIEIARKLQESNPNIVILFLTGHTEYALEAFDVDAVGYLVKPVEKEKLAHVLMNAIAKVKAKREEEPVRELIITEDNIKKKIRVNDIIYVERLKAQCILHTQENEYGIYDTITALAEKLGEGFIRVSQSFIVKISEITKVTYKEVTLKNGLTLSIGRQYTQEVKKAYLDSRTR